MMTSANDAAPPKRDLHVGGVGSAPTAALATAETLDPLTEASESLLRKATDLVDGAQHYVRENPWTAIGVVGLVGLATGYFLSRRS